MIPAIKTNSISYFIIQKFKIKNDRLAKFLHLNLNFNN